MTYRHTAILLSLEVCHGVSVEPHFQSISGETVSHCSVNTNNFRLGVSA